MGYSLTFLLWLQALVPLLVLAITFYVLIIKPLEKQRDERQFLETLAPGMRVITRDKRSCCVIIVLQSTVIVAFDDGTKAEVLKQNLWGQE